MIDLSIETERYGDARYVVGLTGEVDPYTAPALERELLELISNGGSELIVDLSATSFIDSSFLGVILAARERLSASGGRLAIVCGDRNLVRVFEITGLDRVFEIEPTVEAARQPRLRLV